ncbi:MAG: hypothetical protein A4E66_01978 [Syntrophus sp. PtaB.Bin001]|nr:MAG: hypothetical protein A4E66_01978 [Syntrophus sp. PtaB.Bin001]
MFTNLSKKNICSLMFMIALSVLFFLPTPAFSLGNIQINKGTVLTLTDIDDAAKGGPESSFLNRKYSGSSDSNPERKTLRAMAKSSPGSKASYWAKMGSRFSVLKGNGGETFGRIRITVYGLSCTGSVNTPRASAGKALLKFSVSNMQKNTRSELSLLTATGNGSSPKMIQKENFSGSLDVQVSAGDAITVELELIVTAGSGFQNIPAEVDFYSGKNKVSFEGMRVEVVEADPPLLIAAPAPEQVFLYDNSRCLDNKTDSSLVLKKGENVDDLAKRAKSQGSSETWNDRIACIKIGSNVNRVIVYQNVKFKGKSRVFSRTASNPNGVWSLRGNGWDKSISSISVE